MSHSRVFPGGQPLVGPSCGSAAEKCRMRREWSSRKPNSPARLLHATLASGRRDRPARRHPDLVGPGCLDAPELRPLDWQRLAVRPRHSRSRMVRSEMTTPWRRTGCRRSGPPSGPGAPVSGLRRPRQFGWRRIRRRSGCRMKSHDCLATQAWIQPVEGGRLKVLIPPPVTWTAAVAGSRTNSSPLGVGEPGLWPRQ